jgi:hypothetical protein
MTAVDQTVQRKKKVLAMRPSTYDSHRWIKSSRLHFGGIPARPLRPRRGLKASRLAAGTTIARKNRIGKPWKIMFIGSRDWDYRSRSTKIGIRQ